MNKYKVQKIILCEVSIWGYVEANNMREAITMAADIATDNRDYDHEIISDTKTISIQVDEDSK